MERLAKWVAHATLGAAALSFAEVFDLSAYSDRVVGFDGKLIAVPYVARKDAGQGWIPENIETGVVVASTDGSRQGASALGGSGPRTAPRTTAKARADGATTVAIPGSDVQIPTEEAEHWVRSFQEHQATARKQAREPALSENRALKSGRSCGFFTTSNPSSTRPRMFCLRLLWIRRRNSHCHFALTFPSCHISCAAWHGSNIDTCNDRMEFRDAC